MAQQPLNSYKTIAGIVSTTNSEVYRTKTGYTSIVLYAQIANTGLGIGTVTFYHQRELRNNVGVTTTQTEVIKNGIVPDSDTLVVLEGRLILERTALKTDSIVLSGISTSVPNHLKYVISILETLNQ
jgi:hypothetical protein